MKRIALLVVMALFAIPSGSAFARDICVVNPGGSLFMFNNVRLLKGKTTPLAGRFYLFGTDPNVPVSGSVTLDSDGLTTRIGVTAYPVGDAIVSFFDYVTGDRNFNASGSFDNVPFSGNDGPEVWTNVPCATTVPLAAPPVAHVGPTPGKP